VGFQLQLLFALGVVAAIGNTSRLRDYRSKRISPVAEAPDWQESIIPLAPKMDEGVAAAAIESLHRSRPNEDQILTHEIMRQRIEDFLTVLQSGEDLRIQWRTHMKTASPLGIVVPAGRASAVLNAFPVLHVIRNKLNCTLPIVVAYYGVEELGNATITFFNLHISDIQFSDLRSLPYPGHHVRSLLPPVPAL